MKKRSFIGMTLIMLAMTITACGGKASSNTSESSTSSSSSSSRRSSSTSEGPKKNIEFSSVTLTNESDKAYVQVVGTQTNYTAAEFKWAWGIKEQNGNFVDGKSNPSAEDFQLVTFDANNSFRLRYCLTDITTLKAGTLYRIYGGTPEKYGDIAFPTNETGARDAKRIYYPRSDENNSIVFDAIQPISYTKASVVEITQENLPDGVTTPGAYVKFGGVNSKNITVEMIEEWHTAGSIAGNFQRIKGGDYALHDHVDTERFWRIEDNYLYVYLYVGFIEPSEGWMTHFDFVGGNAGGSLQLDITLNGETSYTVGDAVYKLYANKNNGTEANYWGCLGVYRENVQ